MFKGKASLTSPFSLVYNYYSTIRRNINNSIKLKGGNMERLLQELDQLKASAKLSSSSFLINNLIDQMPQVSLECILISHLFLQSSIHSYALAY